MKEKKGRVVNLIDLGIKGNSLTAYRGADKRYYSSEEAYLKIKTDKEYWLMCMDKLMEILGYEPGMKLPTVAAKKFSEIRAYGMDVVYETICACEKDGIFEYASNLQYKNEYNKVSYYASIIVNKVGDHYKLKQIKSRIQNTNHVNPMDTEVFYSAPQKKKDISRFLED